MVQVFAAENIAQTFAKVYFSFKPLELPYFLLRWTYFNEEFLIKICGSRTMLSYKALSAEV